MKEFKQFFIRMIEIIKYVLTFNKLSCPFDFFLISYNFILHITRVISSVKENVRKNDKVLKKEEKCI